MLHRIGEFLGRAADRNATILLTSGCAAVGFGCLVYFGHIALTESAINPHLHAGILGIFVGVGTGAATAIVMLARRERRRALRDELNRLAELNHRLRNGLQLIASAHFSGGDETHRKMMMDAVASIDSGLKQLFPTMGFEHRKQARRQRPKAS